MYKTNKSFTLIELLIASSISVIIVLSIYSAFQTGILSYHKIDSSFELYLTVRNIFNRIELDLSNSFIYAASDSRLSGTAQNLDFFSILDSFDREGKTSSNLCRIKYELSSDTLKRACCKNLDALGECPGAEAEELSSNIKGVSFKYLYATGNPDNPYDWQGLWPQEGNDQQKKSLPLSVKIELMLREKGNKEKEGLEGRTLLFSKVVPLPAS